MDASTDASADATKNPIWISTTVYMVAMMFSCIVYSLIVEYNSVASFPHCLFKQVIHQYIIPKIATDYPYCLTVLPEEMPVPAGAGIGRPGVVEPVALDLERSAGAGQLVAHLLEEAAEGGLFDRDQPTPQLVPSVMVAAEIK